jgi:outer membrane protein OmpA-like peptidoglycan-associated protein
LWFGEGVKKRRGLARELCREACQAGDPNACLGPNFQLAARAAVGKRDAALMPAVAPPPPEVVQVPRPNLAEGMAWLPRPVCEWQPSQVAADTLFANAWRLEPLIVDASSRLSGVAPAPAPEPEVAKEPERRPKRRAAAVPEDLGLLIVGSWPGDKVTIGGEDVPSAADGVVVYEGPEGAVDFEVTGGGRSEAYPVVVTPGYAVWVDVAQPPVARVLFPVNGAVLDEAAQAVVDAVASRAGTWTFSITGSYSAEGDIGRNLALARARAAATRAALIGAGVSAEAVEVGQPQPPEPGLSMEEQRAAVVRPQAPEGM